MNIMQAQDLGSADDQKVIIYLKTGSVIEAEVIEWDFGNSITIKLPWGSQSVLLEKNIKKIIQKSTLDVSDHFYNYEEKGLYYSFKSQLITGNAGPRANGVFGLGVSLSAGKKLSRLFNVGGGIGYDRFIWDSGENVVPIFAEISGFFNRSNASVFYNIQSGYSLAFTDEDVLIVDAKGGFMIYPSIGLRFGKEKHKFTFDVGYKFQNAEFTYLDPWFGGNRYEQTLQYKRLSIRFGILL